MLVKQGLEEPRAIQVHPYKGWLFYMCCLVSGVGEAGSGGASCDTGSPVQGLVVVHCCLVSGVGEAGSGGASCDTGSPVQGLVVLYVFGFRCW